MWRFRFGKAPSGSLGAIVFLFHGVFQTSVCGTLPWIDDAMTVIARVIFQIVGA
jgi:hypothetical protein